MKDIMRVGIDARVLYRPLRGIGKYLFNILDHMIRIDPSVRYELFYEDITGSKNVPESDRISEKKFAIKGYRFHSWEQIMLPYEIKKSGVSIFHSPANTVPLFKVCPTVVTVHDTILMESEESGNLFYSRTVLPLALKKAKKIITISENSKKDLIRFLRISEDKIEVIYHGINSVFCKIEDSQNVSDSIKKYGIRQKYIFALGAVGARKNIDVLIDAFLILKREKKIGHQLVISGMQEIGIAEYYNKVKALGLQDDVIITGYVPEQDLVALYNGAEVFTYLSLYEGFGFPVLESMACGTPVVASNVSSIPELIGKSGMLVNPKSVNEISEAILAVIQNRKLQDDLVEEGFKQVKKFSWEKAAQRTLSVYKQVIKDAS